MEWAAREAPRQAAQGGRAGGDTVSLTPELPEPVWTARTEAYWKRYTKTKGGPDECWPWGGSVYTTQIRAGGEDGYLKGTLKLVPTGAVRGKRSTYQLGRVVVWRATGVWPGNRLVVAVCGNGCCHNPRHYTVGDVAMSARIRVARGSGQMKEGLVGINGCIAHDIVRAIRRDAAMGVGATTLARRYKVSSGAARRIVLRTAYAYVGDIPGDEARDSLEVLGAKCVALRRVQYLHKMATPVERGPFAAAVEFAAVEFDRAYALAVREYGLERVEASLGAGLDGDKEAAPPNTLPPAPPTEDPI